MCTRFVYRGDEVITGFNFDIDPAVWDYQIMEEEDRFYIGILRPDGARHAYTVFTETAMPEHCCMSMEIPQGPMRTGKAV